MAWGGKFFRVFLGRGKESGLQLKGRLNKDFIVVYCISKIDILCLYADGSNLVENGKLML